VATLAPEVERLLPGSRAVTVAGMVKAQTGSVATMKRYSAVLLVAGVALVAGVVAALVASQARRRRREVGLLVAVGAPPAGIAWTFTLQAALAGALGGLAGWLLAVPAAGWLGTRALGTALAAPADLLVPAVILSALVSALAASFPARRAAALDPTEVLRES
jgi:putative ABC transport system permease protein